MAIQNIALGTAPLGTGGDTFRSAATKINANFSDATHAASRLVGTATGNVMQVGALGLGATVVTPTEAVGASNPTGFYYKQGEPGGQFFLDVRYNNGIGAFRLSAATYANRYYLHAGKAGTLELNTPVEIRHSGNTTVDANGFIKNASPIIKLFADKIKANDEAQEQNPVFEKIDIGHYLIKNTEGFAKQGWWIEVPIDSNGNKICAIEYQTLENADLEVKTFKKMLNEDGDIVANLDKPIDIPNNANDEPRWIDIRLHSTPKAVVHHIPRTEKQPKLVQQIKYAPQLVYIMSEEDMKDDDGKLVIVSGKTQKIQKPYIQTDANGTPILQDQPVINENSEVVFEWVQAVDSEGNPIFEDVPVLDADGKQIVDEVIHEPEQ